MADDDKHKPERESVLIGVTTYTLAFIGFGSLILSVLGLLGPHSMLPSGMFAIAAAVSLGLLLNALLRD